MMLINEDDRFMWRVAPQSLRASYVNLRLAILEFMREILKCLGLNKMK